MTVTVTLLPSPLPSFQTWTTCWPRHPRATCPRRRRRSTCGRPRSGRASLPLLCVSWCSLYCSPSWWSVCFAPALGTNSAGPSTAAIFRSRCSTRTAQGPPSSWTRRRLVPPAPSSAARWQKVPKSLH